MLVNLVLGVGGWVGAVCVTLLALFIYLFRRRFVLFYIFFFLVFVCVGVGGGWWV